MDIMGFQEIVEEVSRLDGAVGWNLMIGAEGGAIAAFLPPEASQRIYGEGTVGAGSTNPAGRAEVVAGGYRVNGRWPLASGCQHAGWMIGMSVIVEDGQPRIAANGSPELRMTVFRPEDCQIEDTWFSGGLRGTGSHHFAVQDAFVPAENSFAFPPVLENPAGPLYRAALPVLLAAPLASVALGIAGDAIDSFIELAKDKTPVRA
jgi:alkylation response protein AidB-like acyl-CoA dehydrogenase